MALRLGDIDFGLGVDTRRLNKAVDDVVKFGSVVEQASARTAKGSATIAASLRKQEKALLGALEKTLKFNDAVRKSGGRPEFITSMTGAFSGLTQELAKTGVKALDFQRAMERFDTDFGRNTRRLNLFKASMLDAGETTGNFSVQMRNLAGAATLAVGPLSGIGARITAFSAITNRSNIAIAGMITGITVASLTLLRFSQAAITAARNLERAEVRLEAITGSSTLAAAQLDSLKTLADQTGTSFLDLANGFSRMASAAQGTALEGDAINQIFEDLTFSAAQFRLEAVQVEGVMRAFEQIISKGTVQAEELRGQLGDRLPGAFQIAARAMKVSTEELNAMLKAGEVVSTEFLGPFAAELRRSVGAAGAQEIDNFQASVGRLRNSIDLFNLAFDETFGISDKTKAVLDATTTVVKALTNNLDLMARVAGAAAGALLGIAGPTILRGLVAFTTLIQGATKAIIVFSAALLANPITALPTLLTRVGLGIAGAVAGFALLGKSSDSATQKQQALIERIDDFIRAQEETETTTTKVARALEQDLRKSIEATIAEIDTLKKSLSPEAFPEGAIDLFNMDESTIRDINVANESLNEARKRLEALVQAQEELAERERVAAQEKESARKKRLEGLTDEIRRIEQLAAATLQSSNAATRLEREYDRVDAIKEFIADLEKEGATLQESAKAALRYTQAYDKLETAKAVRAIDDVNSSIERTLQLAEATAQGDFSLGQLEQTFQRQDILDQQRESLQKFDLTASQVEATIESLAQALDTLAQSEADKAIGDLELEMSRLQQRAQLIEEGGFGLAAFDRSVAVESAVKKVEQELSRVQISGERAAAIIETFKTSLESVDAAELAKGLQDINREIADMRARAEATAQGDFGLAALGLIVERRDAIEDFQNRIKDLVDTEEEAAEATEAFADSFDNLKAAERAKEIAEIRTELVRYEAQLASILKTGNSDAFDAAASIADSVVQFRDSLVAAGASVQNINSDVSELVRLLNSVSRAKAMGAFKEAAEDAAREIASLEKQLEAFNAGGPLALQRVQDQIDLEDKVREFRDRLIEAQKVIEVSEQQFILDERLASADTEAGKLLATYDAISNFQGLENPVDILIARLQEASGIASNIQLTNEGFPIGGQSLPSQGGSFNDTSAVTASFERLGDINLKSATLIEDVIKRFEGFISTPKFDVNAFRAGFGSETITLADGTVKRITEGMKVSLEDANRDLARRLTEFLAEIENIVGPELFKNLTEPQLAALASIDHNFGTIPDRVAEALQTGVTENVVRAIESLQGLNGGINDSRRRDEAQLFASSGESTTTTTRQPAEGAIDFVQQNTAIAEAVRLTDQYEQSLLSLAEAQTLYAQAQALFDAERVIADQRAYNDALLQGPQAVQALNDALSNRDALEAFRDMLIEAGVAQETINQKMLEFSILLEEGTINEALVKLTEDAVDFRSVMFDTFKPGGVLAQGIANNLAQVLTFQKTWKQAVFDIASTIATQLIGALIQTGINMIIQATIGQALAQAITTSSAAQGAAVAAAWAPAAAMVSLATFGANAVPALAAITATVASTAALQAGAGALGGAVSAGSSRAFAEGGLIRGQGGTQQDRVNINASPGEYIVSAAATREYLPLLELINSGGGTSAPPQSSGGRDRATENGDSADGLQIVNVLDPSIVGDFLRTSDGRKLIVNIMRSERASLK